MRRAAKVDDNQAEIVEAARKMGCTVQILSHVGFGCPDLLIGCNGVNLLWEVKDGKKPPSERRLNPDQIIWHGDWRGQVQVIETIDQAVRAINYVRRAFPVKTEQKERQPWQ
jgi:hypothetical protein